MLTLKIYLWVKNLRVLKNEKITLKENERSNSDKKCNMNGDNADTVERKGESKQFLLSFS